MSNFFLKFWLSGIVHVLGHKNAAHGKQGVTLADLNDMYIPHESISRGDISKQ